MSRPLLALHALHTYTAAGRTVRSHVARLLPYLAAHTIATGEVVL